MSQKQQVLDYLRSHDEVTPQDALRDLGIFRLAARVHELRREGYAISMRESAEKGERYAIYSLVREGAA